MHLGRYIMERETKTAIIRRHMADGDWRKAIAQAAKLPRMGKHRNAILDAHGAFVRPKWVKQIGKDVPTLIAAGIAALTEKFGDKHV